MTRSVGLFNLCLIGISLLIISSDATLYEGDSCLIRDGPGICTNQEACPQLKRAFYLGHIRNDEIPRCGYTTYGEIICCPISNIFKRSYLQDSDTIRPAIKFCSEIEQNSSPLLTEHILNGLPVNMGEFPHMAAIGTLAEDGKKYKYFCGGSLISNKFVLTAAHCVVNRIRRPEVVLLGVISLNETDAGILIRVLETYPHSEYKPGSSYNDIAIIELVTAVENGNNVSPTCLNVNDSDIPMNAELYISGWGRTLKERFSNQLLKARVGIVPSQDCNQQVAKMSPTRLITQGIQNIQICANSLESTFCDGDSGGPLMLVKNKDLQQYRIVGIIAANFNCGGSTPGLYTRVSEYLDFIESIVWPR